MSKKPLGEVSLSKGGQARISLDKGDHDVTVTASLQWDGGSDQRRQRGADLDLYALYVPAEDAVRSADHAPGYVFPQLKRGFFGPKNKDEAKALEAQLADRTDAGQVVYYKRLGSLKTAPYMKLSGDAKIPGEETITIVRPDLQGYALICAYSAVENGRGSFRSFGARAVVSDGRGSEVTVPLYEEANTSYWVAIAFIDFTDPQGVEISHVERYARRATEKRPVLHTDGTVLMDAGPVEFKRS
ncbi:hypothetical protein HRW23_16110 [Streptomyces lunaelactis]|uniref:hypothetical protein n=1 Tax=Streptomyces lunaelactis TaxID=1535768 RepID=UPI0015849975|nr:hypothetical protein [Streptomyces lunaelactis]NUK02295.1 hypothetical protein [Streptomyces lunaelactis]NUK09027.1 hypothetical protein [Streptomyces lunaelactis]NUK15855.1 hypothetical protein [Streptomyces lunaelactis]NUK23384.1 hypothetical protein [Streptomyces lunaelactis]NUK35015.1 hypothetical protein [Streptomyces lunaelactis]